MKNFIENFKKLIRFSVTIFASREFAFIYCLVGTGSQVAHTYFLTEAISSFDGGFRVFQATMVSFFISSSLLYFVAVADNDGSKESRRNHLAVNIFMVIEILINFYYYSRHLLIDAEKWQIFDFIFAVLVSCLLPVTIKLYANTIRAKQWIEEMSNPVITENTNNQIVNEEYFNEMIDKIKAEFGEEIDTKFSEKLIELQDFIDLDKINSQISNSFETNQKLFLDQFENKCRLFLKKQIETSVPENTIVTKNVG
jgi:heme/copper-type cytochrome/quinol oxidase subunit 4